MTITEIQHKLYENLKPSGWADKLKMFILSEEFAEILKVLYSESKSGLRFTPTLKDLFKAFQECPYKDLKVVFVGQDPYPQAGVADGISFSCSYTQKVNPSLRYIFKEIEDTVYSDGYEWNPDLTRWSNQGVLMLNTALTCTVNKIGSHIDLWKPFITYLFDVLNNNNNGLLYVFLGKKSQDHHKSISAKSNFKFMVTHPASAAYRGGAWDSNDLFNKLNGVVEKHYKEKITW